MFRIRIRIGNGVNQVCGSGSRRAKMTHENGKKLTNFMFWSARCSLLRAEGFFRSMGVRYGGLGIKVNGKFWSKKYQFFLSLCTGTFFPFLVIDTWIRIGTGIQPKMLDPDPESMNLDPKHCCLAWHSVKIYVEQAVYRTMILSHEGTTENLCQVSNFCTLENTVSRLHKIMH